MIFQSYLAAAVAKALQDEADGSDNGELQYIHDLCRKGVQHNWAELAAKQFLTQYLWCVGSIQKNYEVHVGHWKNQLALFRHGDTKRIAKQAAQIRKEWTK